MLKSWIISCSEIFRLYVIWYLLSLNDINMRRRLLRCVSIFKTLLYVLKIYIHDAHSKCTKQILELQFDSTKLCFNFFLLNSYTSTGSWFHTVVVCSRKCLKRWPIQHLKFTAVSPTFKKYKISNKIKYSATNYY